MQLSKKSKTIYLSALLFGLIPSIANAEPYHENEVQQPSMGTIQLGTTVFNSLYDVSMGFVQLNNELKEQEEKAQQEQLMLQQQEEQQQEREEQRLKEELERRRIENEFMKHMSSTNKIVSFDLTTPSGLTVEEANSILDGTNLKGLGKAFIKAEKTYNVNAVYLMAHAAWESGWGTSKISQTKNNLFGFGAYDNSPGKSAIHFQSKSDCILTVAKYVNEHYLQEQGDHYNGPTLKGMNIKYASDGNWAQGISQVMISLVDKKNKNNSL